MTSSINLNLGSLPNLPSVLKFDVSQLKSKIDDAAATTKKTFSAITGVTYNNTKPKKSKYYYQFKDAAPQMAEEEFLKIIPAEFFEKDFDTTRYLLNMLPANDSDFSQFLDKHTDKYTRCMDYVNSKLHSRVKKNYTEFVEGMSQIHEIGVELQRSTVICATSRRTLGNTKKNLNTTAFNIMANDGDYPSTIKSYHKCREILQRVSHYSLPELSSNLNEIYGVVQERIDKDFFNCCRTFNANTYRSVFEAYKLLNRANQLLDKLEKYFVKPIEPEIRNIVYSHVLLSEEAAMNPEAYKNVEYKDLCRAVTNEHFVNCILAVFEYLSDVMTSLYLMNQFHVENPDGEESNIFADISSALTRFKKTIWDTMQKQVTALLARKLTTFKIDDFQLILNSVTKISEIGEEFSGDPSHHLKKSIIDQSKAFFDHFHKTRVDDLRTMLEHETWVNMPVAADFNAATELRLKKRMQVDRDKQLSGEQIFYAIRDHGNPFSQLISYKNKRTSTSPTFSPTLESKQQQTKQEQKKEDDSDEDEELKQEIIEEDDDDDHARRKLQYQKQQQLKKKKAEETPNFLVASSTISFVRYIGKYLEMMEQLPHISLDIFNAICQFVEYYMYTIYSFSGYLDPQGFSLEALTTKMEKTLSSGHQVEDLSFTKPALNRFINKTKERLGIPIVTQVASAVSGISTLTSFTSQLSQIKSFANDIINNTSPTLPSATSPYSNNNNSNIQAGTLAPTNQDPSAPRWIVPRINYNGLRLGDPKECLFNLPVRILAIESLSFVVSALNDSRPVFEGLLPGKYIDQIKSFYDNVVKIIPDLQRHLIKSSVSAIFSHQSGSFYFSKTIADQKWDVKTTTVGKTPYIEAFLKEFQLFFKQLDDAVQKSGFITTSLKNRIIDVSFEYLVQQLVDGYSRIKKCSNEGRAVMIQDLMNLQAGLEKLSKTKIPNIAYAEHYIKGYYHLSVLQDKEIMEWATEHDEYPIKHIINLLQLAKVNKPMLLQQLEEMDKKRRKY
ncbi:hypothetical protein PPL_05082 [Heterostelium album PN500]|uniref:Uncharacterized protein n=1 Tax=Heterostelium pallidum (strain ATCC 26659 / Pp 5 / PN500) TaxID=670386 RepID=D3B9D8_HETP5|nr:hypothetical protein PPL_05082 [Heterostelium album PN500]EFA81850.1 hypothetical protein PPL_05082 [Heterostelium album PN500]|eukprot:XP_020433967.1 hypothetical protein PPL_05082 [Heterostelium album PN500]